MYQDARSKTTEHEAEILDYINNGPKDGKIHILKQTLSKALYDKLKTKETSTGSNLWTCIKSGIIMPESKMGAYACDKESYELFQDLLVPMVHKYFNTTDKHPAVDFGNLEDEAMMEELNIAKADPDNDLIVSTRIRVARNLEGFRYAAAMADDERLKIEESISAELLKIDDPDIKGKYYSMKNMTEAEQQEKVDQHILFHNRDEFIQKAGMFNDWPNGRGAFYSDNTDKRFLVWINEEDHMRIISMQCDNDLVGVWRRQVKALTAIGNALPFAYNDVLGALNSCPTNVGTGLRASVHIKIPLLSAQPWFTSFCTDIGLDIRGTGGEHTETKDGTYDISNRRRFGKTEYECLCEMARGVRTVATMERALAGKCKPPAN